MKKVLCSIFSVLLLSTLLVFGASAETWKADDEANFDQQGPVWYFLSRPVGETEFQELIRVNNGYGMIPSWKIWQEMEEPDGTRYNGITRSGLHLATLSSHDDVEVALAFQAPADGTYTIGSWTPTSFVGSHDVAADPGTCEAEVRILKNDEQIYPESGYAPAVAESKFGGEVVDLKAGDRIYFVVKAISLPPEYPEVSLMDIQVAEGNQPDLIVDTAGTTTAAPEEETTTAPEQTTAAPTTAPADDDAGASGAMVWIIVGVVAAVIVVVAVVIVRKKKK